MAAVVKVVRGTSTAPSRRTATGKDAEASTELTQTVRIPAKPSAVPQIRRSLVADLASAGLPTEVISESESVVAELVANAIRHARPLADGTIRVVWKVKAGIVEIEVSDGGAPTVPSPMPRSVWAATGRGLRIVRSLAHEWGVAAERSGRTVWASVGGPSRRRTR